MRFNTKHVAVCDILSPIFRFIILLSLPVCCRCWCRGCWQYAFFIRVIPTAGGGVWQFAGGPESVIGHLVIVIVIILFWPLPGTRLESTNIILRIIFSVTFSFRLIPNWLLTITLFIGLFCSIFRIVLNKLCWKWHCAVVVQEKESSKYRPFPHVTGHTLYQPTASWPIDKFCQFLHIVSLKVMPGISYPYKNK